MHTSYYRKTNIRDSYAYGVNNKQHEKTNSVAVEVTFPTQAPIKCETPLTVLAQQQLQSCTVPIAGIVRPSCPVSSEHIRAVALDAAANVPGAGEQGWPSCTSFEYSNLIGETSTGGQASCDFCFLDKDLK